MKTRSQSLEIASTKEFDLVVIGGGIAGAGIAQDAASRGLSVALVEKDDFASGTSSKTTKLIHGGLRYLEQLHIKLTRDLCHERGMLEQLAPHMVRDFSFVMPITKASPLFGIKASIGLTLYDLLSWSVYGARHHQRLSQQEMLEAAPALCPETCSWGLKFHDCITDDARMVIEVIKSASRYGALAINYLEVTGFQHSGGHITGVECHDRYNGQSTLLRCKACVNATGVWSDGLFQKLDTAWRNHVTPSKGIHIIVPQSAFETNTALFLPTKDERYVFVVPWQRALMIGTTDNRYHGDINNPLPNMDEIDYLLSVINSYSATYKLNRSDIIGSFAGLRPLVQHDHEDGPTSNLSREHEIFTGPYGIIGLNGGKLTNYRLMSFEVVDKVMRQLPDVQYKPSKTNKIMLGGWIDKQNFLVTTAAISAKARRLSIEPATLDHLIATYGADAQQILDIVEQDSSLNQRICPDFPPILAEIPFCVKYEMVVSLEDLLMRRLRLGILNQRQCLQAAPKVAEIMKLLFQWDIPRMTSELSAFEHTLNEHIELVSQPVASS